MITSTKSTPNSSGMLAFIKELCTHPSRVGAAFPSSKKVAKIVAEQIPTSLSGKIIELGGGTGVITTALLEKGIPENKLIVVERSLHLYKHLKNQFSNLSVINGDAAELQKLISNTNDKISAVVSSLPLRLLTIDVVSRIYQQVYSVLENDGLYIQYTYHLNTQRDSKPKGFTFLYRKIIWSNLPPVRVDVFTKK
jgi:phospholipid N-methyltransferase